MKYYELSIAEKKELKEKLWQESFYNDGYEANGDEDDED